MFEHKEAGYKKILIELLLRIFGNAFIELIQMKTFPLGNTFIKHHHPLYSTPAE